MSFITGGSDTTADYLQFFVLCMLENPAVLAKAQQEIDDVVGHENIPELEDLENLPYLRAVINEVGSFIQPEVYYIYEPFIPAPSISTSGSNWHTACCNC